MEYKSIIFDLDGTLLESTADHIDWIYKCCKEALEVQNIENNFSREELSILLGMDGYKPYISVCERTEIDPEEHWQLVTELRHRKKLEMLQKNDLGLYPEAEETIRKIHDEGIKIGLVSNSPGKTVNEIIDFYNLSKYIEYYRGISNYEDLKHRKPSARNLQIGATELNREPYVYVGNKEEDVEAAENAGIDSILIERDNTGLDANPDILVESLSEIMPGLN